MLRVVFVVLSLCVLSCNAAARRPNIVFVLADDLGWTDLACQGSGYYETPNIDQLAAQGLRLMSHHHAQNCQPTRAALMSGQYGPRTGVYTVGGIDRFSWGERPLRPVDNVTELPLDRTTVAQALKSAGYATAMFGKWHLGEKGEHHPGKRGFDEAISSAGQHFDFSTSPPTEYPKGQYLADFLTDKAEAFIRKNAAQEFFLYLPHFGVHSPHQAKPELVAKFKEKAAAGGHYDATYAAMIASVDESVGRITKLLDELKLAEDTVVIFASDNGGVGGYQREGIKKERSVTDNAPLRNGKGSLYEGGTRVPFIVRWPGKVATGGQTHTPSIHVDLYPTLLELSGAVAPAGQVLDGVSLVPLWKAPSEGLQRSAIFQHFPGYLGAGPGQWRTLPVATVIAGDWKLMEFMEDQRVELYELGKDLGEATNLASAEPQKAQELLSMLHSWQEGIHAPMPQPNTNRTADPAKKGKGKGKGKNKVNAKAE
jgi:arylsulfatase A-like enzyme